MLSSFMTYIVAGTVGAPLSVVRATGKVTEAALDHSPGARMPSSEAVP